MISISMKIREIGFTVISDPLRRSLKSQLRDANRLKASFALILGETEIERGTLCLKNLKNGSQEDILQSEILKYFNSLRT